MTKKDILERNKLRDLEKVNLRFVIEVPVPPKYAEDIYFIKQIIFIALSDEFAGRVEVEEYEKHEREKNKS
jgi:hypothetical protein